MHYGPDRRTWPAVARPNNRPAMPRSPWPAQAGLRPILPTMAMQQTPQISRWRFTRLHQWRYEASAALQPQTGQIEPIRPGARDRIFIPRIGVTHDPARGIVPKHPFEATRRLRGSIGDDHHAGVLRISDADTAAVVQRNPGGPAGTVEQRIEQRPVGYRIRAVAHRLGLAVRARNRAAVEMIAPDHDRRLQLAARHHLVEGEPQAVAVAETDPADPRRE